MDELFNRMRAEAARVGAQSAQPLMGTVTSYDPHQYAAKVVLMPEGAFPEQEGDLFETDWIPVSTHWSGDGWGLFMPPSPGDQVHVKFVDGEHGSAVIDGRVFDLSHNPLPVPSGEFWLVHGKGAYAKFTNDGKVAAHSTEQVSAGNLGNAIHTLVMQTFQALFNAHTHGHGPAPDQQMTDAHLTSILKGN